MAAPSAGPPLLPFPRHPATLPQQPKFNSNDAYNRELLDEYINESKRWVGAQHGRTTWPPGSDPTAQLAALSCCLPPARPPPPSFSRLTRSLLWVRMSPSGSEAVR